MIRVVGVTMPFRTMVVLAALALLAGGCGFGGGEEVALRRFPYPYLAAVAASPAAEDTSTVGVLFRGRLDVSAGPEVRTIGQDAPCSLIDWGKQLTECLRAYFSSGVWPSGVYFGNRLLDVVGGAYAAKRYTSGPRVPVIGQDGLDDLLGDRALLELEAKGGYMLFSSSSLPTVNVAALAERIVVTGRADRVQAVTADELLTRWVLEHSLNWSCEMEGGWVVIRIDGIDDTVAGAFEPSLEDLAGVTFYTPAPERTRVLLDGESVSGLVINPPDHTHRPSVTLSGAAIRSDTAP